MSDRSPRRLAGGEPLGWGVSFISVSQWVSTTRASRWILAALSSCFFVSFVIWVLFSIRVWGGEKSSCCGVSRVCGWSWGFGWRAVCGLGPVVGVGFEG